MIYQNPAREGDVKLFKVEIDDQDVTDAVTMVDVFQDIFSPSWSAQVFFDDTNNLLTTLPIQAGSEIRIQARTEFGFDGDGTASFTMTIYRVGDKRMDNHMHLSYTVFAAHRAMFVSQKKRIRKSFDNKNPEEIVRSICSEELEVGLESERADNNINLCIPNWSPLQAIAWICKHAMFKQAADYCFFQEQDTKFAFKPFEQMYFSEKEKVRITFRLRPHGPKDNGDVLEDFTPNVLRYHFEHFDSAAAGAAGMYKNQTVSFDLINKKWESFEFEYGDDCKQDKQGQNFKADELSSKETNISWMPKHPEMFENPSYLDTIDKWVGSRKSAVQKMDSEKLIIQIAGAGKSQEWLGKNVMVDLPSQEDFSGETLDKYRKGRYVIVAICHHIGKDSYVTNLELVKKRLEENP